ncbi:phosphonoacetaldehyde dehydrogenase [Paraburkholderia rhynchosiae]|uniref:Phosphonoacetaldehyde dehydrogenase n=1 Tax=Paraburkholderia rhynchosiae TaxID=487049 RepID=A0A2N7VZ34_9BURK|nr:phosphonoacetaldehyde dehydrogenase [Paraburkholderia rhynchosiae]PMS22422.1 phosphonoacetaldehyde dehydrogenase [Paraburkholderia rhynchosiae]CAB3738160.1 Phosphonoacetaldehyde dehydrogenase [Paraburkholderia rhynchosiae]
MNAIVKRKPSSTVRHEAMRIGGERITRAEVIEVLNPYTGALVGSVPRATVDDVRRAFDYAHAYRAQLTRYERSQILRRAADIVRERTYEISDLITAESGLCRKDSIYEAGRVSDVLIFGANEALRDDGQIFSCDLTPHGKQRRVYTQRDPLLGVICAITPFNHPMNQVAHKIVPAIATNNRIVVKPSEKVPLSTCLLADILYSAGLPPEMLQVVTGDPRDIADELITNEHVDLITFTGGVAIGKHIAARMGYRRAVLELGGNDPLIVMEDADLEEASTLAVAGSYKNSGQRCTAIKRMLIHEAVADRFVDLLVEKTHAVRYGDPADPDTDMGTVIDEAAARFFEAQVNDALSRGAQLLAGNVRRGALYSPTVVDRVTPDMPLVRYETFGPVSPVIRFRDIDDAIRIANSTEYGLSSSVCTNRLDYITRFVSELHVGSVNVREVPGYRLELTPFGGIKDSGLGYKEGVQEAIKSFTNLKTYSLPWD